METNQLMTDRIRAIRVNIDADMQKIPLASAYLTLAYRQTQQCRHWLGKLLSYIGEENPYHKVSKTKDIPEQVDKAMDIGEMMTKEGDELLAFLNDFRDRFEEHAEDIWVLLSEPEITRAANYSKLTVGIEAAYVSIRQAKFWLGEEIGVLRDSVKENEKEGDGA